MFVVQKINDFHQTLLPLNTLKLDVIIRLLHQSNKKKNTNQ